MIDPHLRRLVDPALDRMAAPLARRDVHPLSVTTVGLVVGVAGCVAVASGRPWLGLALLAANRVLDGVDGTVARIVGPTRIGGVADLLADFTIYGGAILAVGVAHPDTAVAAAAVLFAYYLSGASVVFWVCEAERASRNGAGRRRLDLGRGIAEGGETIVATGAAIALGDRATPLLAAWAVIVLLGVAHRLRALALADRAVD